MKKFVKGLAALLLTGTMATAGFAACGGDTGGDGGSSSSETSSESIVITIVLDKEIYTLEEDSSFVLTATTNSTRSVRWTSDNPTVASVNAVGKVLAKAPGTAVIKAEAEGESAECVVAVTARSVESGALLRVQSTKLMMEMQTEATAQIGVQYVTVSGDDERVETDKAFAFESADESIATVSESGLVTPVGVGTTEVVITSGDLVEYVTVDVYTAAVCDAQSWLEMFEDPTNDKARYYLTNDIDFTGYAYDIGTLADSGNIENNYFGGEINGDGWSVKNVTMQGNYQSLFGTAVGLRLRNISFENILFTAEAVRAAGIAHTFGHHNDKGVFESNLSNVSLDLVFETAMGTGISWTNYGMNLNNAFIRMRKGENSTVTEFPDDLTSTGYVDHETLPSHITTQAFMGVSRMAYNWGYGKSSMSNVVVYSEFEGAGGVIGYGYGNFDGDNVVYCETQMHASYYGYQIFDHSVWSVHPERLPSLIKKS